MAAQSGKTPGLPTEAPRLPDRFEHPETWEYKVKKQHPLYQTSNSGYGAKPPCTFQMPRVYHGISSTFSEGVCLAGPQRDGGPNMKNIRHTAMRIRESVPKS